MNFIEQLFGLSPDAGLGTFELLLFVVPVTGVALLALRRMSRTRR